MSRLKPLRSPRQCFYDFLNDEVRKLEHVPRGPVAGATASDAASTTDASAAGVDAHGHAADEKDVSSSSDVFSEGDVDPDTQCTSAATSAAAASGSTIICNSGADANAVDPEAASGFYRLYDNGLTISVAASLSSISYDAACQLLAQRRGIPSDRCHKLIQETLQRLQLLHEQGTALLDGRPQPSMLPLTSYQHYVPSSAPQQPAKVPQSQSLQSSLPPMVSRKAPPMPLGSTLEAQKAPKPAKVELDPAKEQRVAEIQRQAKPHDRRTKYPDEVVELFYQLVDGGMKARDASLRLGIVPRSGSEMLARRKDPLRSYKRRMKRLKKRTQSQPEAETVLETAKDDNRMQEKQEQTDQQRQKPSSSTQLD